MVEEKAVGLGDDVRLRGGGSEVILILQDGLLLCSRHLDNEARREREREREEKGGKVNTFSLFTYSIKEKKVKRRRWWRDNKNFQFGTEVKKD